MCFFLGVSLNVIGATTSLMATSSLPSPEGLQEDLVAYQRAIEEAERISKVMGAPDTSQLMVCVLVLRIVQLNGQDDEQPTSLLTINWSHGKEPIIVTSQICSLAILSDGGIYRDLCMLWWCYITGVGSFFLGLIFFIIDTQPVAVWVTILLISLISYILTQGIKWCLPVDFCSLDPIPGRCFGECSPHRTALQRKRGLERQWREGSMWWRLCTSSAVIKKLYDGGKYWRWGYWIWCRFAGITKSRGFVLHYFPSDGQHIF